MHARVLAQRGSELPEKTLHQFVARLRRRGDFVIACDALRLVVAHATADQVELVAKIIVEHAVRERRVLRDFAQTGSRKAEFAERLQRRFGKFDPPRSRFLLAQCLRGLRNPLCRCHGSLRHSVRSFVPCSVPFRLWAATRRHRNQIPRNGSQSTLTIVKTSLDSCKNRFGRSSRLSGL